MADKSLSTIASELWQGFGNNPRNVETFDTLANVFPPAMLYRGAKTLANTDFGAIKDALMGKYQISQTPRQDLQRAGQAITDLGFGAMDVAPALPLVKPALKAAAPIAARQAVNLVEKYGVSPVMNVVKPEGPSNWLPGSIEQATRRLKSSPAPVENLTGAQIQERGLGDIWRELHEGPNMHLGTYDRLQYLIEKYPDRLAEFGYQYSPRDTAINTWIDRRLNPYIRNEMSTPNDPLRALAEEDRLHFVPQHVYEQHGHEASRRRFAAGFPTEGEANSELARQWETLSDSSIQGKTAKQWRENASPEVLEKMPWLEHLGPDEIVYERTKPGFHDMGFDHLVDELKNAVNPDSALPQHLRLTTKQLEQMTVPRASEHVTKINEWRAGEATRAEKQGYKAHLSAPPSHVDESFELSFVDEPGGKWVDIPETVDDNGLKMCTSIGKAGGWCTQDKPAATRYGSGDNRLSVLLDADGRPHAQATISQPKQLPSWEYAQTFLPQAEEEAARLMPNGYTSKDVSDIAARMAKEATPPDITELKPVSNTLTSERASQYTKRDGKYAEKVAKATTNFLNSRKFGTVASDDLKRLGIVDVHNPEMLEKILDMDMGADIDTLILAFEQAPADLPRFMTDREFKQYITPYMDTAEPTQAFAAGGLVASDYDEEQIDKLSDSIFETAPSEGGVSYRDYPNPYGLRAYRNKDGSYGGEMLPKAEGWAGEQRGRGNLKGSTVTEYSMDDERGSFPSINPLLSLDEIDAVAAGNMTPEIYKKAVEWRDLQARHGASAFKNPTGFAKGGEVKDPFADLSIVDKAKLLAKAAKYRVQYNKQAKEHGKYPDILSSALKEKYLDEVGNSRVNRSPLDAAINYGGGYDFGVRGDIPIDVARDMAKAYQYTDYFFSPFTGPKADAVGDYYENMAGVEAGIKERARRASEADIARRSAEYGRRTSKMLPQYEEPGYAEGGAVNTDLSKYGIDASQMQKLNAMADSSQWLEKYNQANPVTATPDLNQLAQYYKEQSTVPKPVAPVVQQATAPAAMPTVQSVTKAPMYTKHEGMLYGDDFYDRYAQNRGGQYADPYHNFLMTSARVIGPDNDIEKLYKQYQASGRTDTPDWATVDTKGPISIIPKLAHYWDASGATPVTQLSSAWNPTTPLAEGVTVPEGYWDNLLAYNMNLSKAHPSLMLNNTYMPNSVKGNNLDAMFALANNIYDIDHPAVVAFREARMHDGAVGDMEVGALQRQYANYLREQEAAKMYSRGYAEGGLVYNDEEINNLADQLLGA